MNQLDLFERDTEDKVRKLEKWMFRLQRELWRLKMTQELIIQAKKNRTFEVIQLEFFKTP